MDKDENKISTRITKRCSDDIDTLVRNGHAMNRSDFVRDALKEHIRRCSSETDDERS